MKYLLSILILFMTVGNAFGQKKKHKFSVGHGFGYQSNIFLAPEIYVNQSDDTLYSDDLYQNGTFHNTDLKYGFNWRIKKKSTFTASSRLNYLNFYNPDLQPFYGLIGQGNIDYQYNFKKYTYLKIGVQSRRKRTIRTTITGDEYVRPYSYISYYPKMIYQQRLFKNAYMLLNAGYDLRTYDGNDSIENFQSLSYNSINYGATFKYKHKLFKRLMMYQLKYINRDRNFTEWTIDGVFDPLGAETSLDELLADDPSYVAPLRKWYYDIVDFEIAYLLSKKVKLSAMGGWLNKADVELGDIGFTTTYYGLGMRYKTKRFMMHLEGKTSTRSYHNRFAYVLDTEPEQFLYYDFLNLNFGLNKSFKNGFGFGFDFTFEDRFSNSSDIEKKFRRSYRTYNVLGSVSYKIETKKKRKKKKRKS